MAIVVSNAYSKSKDAYPCFKLVYNKIREKIGLWCREEVIMYVSRQGEVKVKERETKTSPFERVQLPWPAIWGKTDKPDPTILWFHCGALKRDVAHLFFFHSLSLKMNHFMLSILPQRKMLCSSRGSYYSNPATMQVGLSTFIELFSQIPPFSPIIPVPS